MSDILQAENKRTGGALDLKTAFNASAPATLPGGQDTAVSRVHAEQDREKADILERSRRLPGDPDALGGLRGVDARTVLRNLIKEAKKKDKNSLQKLLIQTPLGNLAEAIIGLHTLITNAIDALNKEREAALDHIHEITEKLDNAQAAMDAGRTQRDKNGNFIDPAMQIIWLDYCNRHNLDPNEARNCSNETAMDAIREEMDDKDRELVDETNKVEVIDRLTAILEKMDVP